MITEVIPMWGILKKREDRDRLQKQFDEDFFGQIVLKDKTNFYVKRGQGTIEDPTIFIVRHGIRHFYGRDPDEPWHDAYNWNAYVYQDLDGDLELIDRLEFEDYELTMSFIEDVKTRYTKGTDNPKVKIFNLPDHPDHGKQRIVVQEKDGEWYIIQAPLLDYYIGDEAPENAQQALELLEQHEGEQEVFNFVSNGYSDC